MKRALYSIVFDAVILSCIITMQRIRLLIVVKNIEYLQNKYGAFMNKIIICSMITCLITNSSLGMFRFSHIIKNTNIRKRCYHTNPDDKYEKHAQAILNGTFNRRRKHLWITQTRRRQPLSDTTHNPTDSNSENRLQTQSLEFFQNQQLLSIALNASNIYDPYSSSISHSTSYSDSSHNGSNPDV